MNSNWVVASIFIMKLIAEIFGTYFLIFAGCGSVVINNIRGNMITFPGISIVWGLAVMVVVYSTGHISGAHLNPAVTIAFATCKRFPWKHVCIAFFTKTPLINKSLKKEFPNIPSLSLSLGTCLCSSSSSWINISQWNSKVDIQRTRRSLYRNTPKWVEHSISCLGIHYHVLPHVRYLRRRHRQQSCK